MLGIALLLCLGQSRCAAAAPAVPPAPEWRVAAASVRLRVAAASRKSHLLRIDLPLACPPECRAGAAFLSPGGDTVPCSPVFLHDRLVAVECLVPWQGRTPYDTAKKSELPLEVYLLPGADVPVPVPAAERKPVCIRRTVRRLTTRPFTPAEALRMLGALRDLPFVSRDHETFSADMPLAGWNSPPGRTTAILHWSADLLLNQDADLRVGADRDSVAWFAFLDHAPVADWKNGRRLASGARMSPTARLTAGFHRLDLIAFQGQDESIPQLLYSEKDAEPKPLPPENLYDADLPDAVLMERKDGGPGIGLRLGELTRVCCGDPVQDLLLFTAAPLGVPPDPAGGIKHVLRLGDRTRDMTGAETAEAVPGSRLPALSLTRTAADGARAEFSLPPRHVWRPPTLIQAELHVRQPPVLLPDGQPLCVEVQAVLPGETGKRLHALAVLRLIQTDAAGTVLDRQANPLPDDATQIPVRLALNPKAARVELDLAVHDVSLLRPVRVRLLRPGDDLAGVQARQRSLRVDGDHAVLICNRLEPLPRRDTAPGRVAVLDDFWAVATGPDADLLPEQRLTRPGTGPAVRFTVFDDTDGAVSEVRKFAVLPRALAAAPAVLVCAVGACELRAGVKPEEMALHLLFLAQAAHGVGAMPVLVTVPPLPGIDRDRTRKAALLTKELGFRLGVPVVDTYSRTVRETGAAPGFETRFVLSDGSATLATPDNAGREWLRDQVEAALAEKSGATAPP